MQKMTLDEAILALRKNPKYSDLIRDAYLNEDTLEAAKCFYQSDEFAEVKRWLGKKLLNATVADIGAGTGIASYALAKSGASVVYAVEPDESLLVGQGAIRRISRDLPISIVDAVAENLPLKNSSVDIVYMRQTLHHILDLPRALNEVARVLRPNGLFIACREHVVDNLQEELISFLEHHAVHQLAGGENAYLLKQYVSAITTSGLKVKKIFYPFENIINAFPFYRTSEALDREYIELLDRRIGKYSRYLYKLSTLRKLYSLRRHFPGNMYSFLAIR